MNTLILKRGLIGALFLAPAMLLIFFWLRPGADFMASLPLFHFYIVTFTTFSAAAILSFGCPNSPAVDLFAPDFANGMIRC